MLRFIVLLSTLITLCVSSYAEDTKPGLHPYVFETNFGEKLNYQAYYPKEITPNLPIVLFLHGAGERGNNNTVQTKHVVPQLIKYSQNNKPCIVIAPQCPSKQQWANISWKLKHHRMTEYPSTPLKLALQLLDKTIEKHKVNKSRIYIVGLSMGGYGTWDAIQRKPNYFAAAVPICGGGDVEKGPLLTKLPIWVWHGDKDGAVPVYRSRSMVESIKKAGGSPIYTELKGVGHNAWTPASESKELWDWLFLQ